MPDVLVIISAFFLFLLIFFYWRLDLGLLALVFLFPFMGLVVDLTKVDAVRHVPFLNQLNASLTDILAVFFLLAWLLRKIVIWCRKKKFSLPFWRAYLPFLISGIVSLARVETFYFSASFKYLWRFLIFFYIALFAPVVDVFKNAPDFFGATYHKTNLPVKALWAMFWAGTLSGLMGLISFFVVPTQGFPRATPFAFFGLAPLGVNHNLLAETLVVTAPFSFLLWWNKKNKGEKHLWLLLSSLGQVFIALTTFSRTAWLALCLQTILFLGFWFGRDLKNVLRRLVWPAILGLLPLAAIFFWTFGANVVRSSTAARLEMARLTWFYFLRSPWLGQGPGMFVPILGSTRAFLLDFGQPLDAHSVILKLIFEQGIFGLLSFFFLVGFLLWRLWQKTRASQKNGTRVELAWFLACLICASGIVFYELFNTTYYTAKLWLPLALAVGLAESAKIWLNQGEDNEI